MSTIIISKEVTARDVREHAGHSKMVFYGANTPWWTTSEDDLYRKPGISGLPCDPRGGMLFQSGEGEISKFLHSAAEADKSGAYGKHGLRAFFAAFHGVVRVKESGLPTCLNTWDDYNALLDAHDNGEGLDR